MKNYYFLLVLLFGIAPAAMSQTLTGTITQVPCNNDGIYSVTATGLPLPITYTYYFGATSVVHENVNSATDQLTNIPMSVYNYIYCEASSGSLYAYSENTYTPAFSFEIEGTSPVCPATMGTISATQISGSSGPFTFLWTNSQTGTAYSGNNASVPMGHYEAEIADLGTGCMLNIAGDTAISIFQESNVTATFNTTMASCTNGTATAVPSGGVAPYTYLWANGSTSATITGLSAGYYPVTVMDAQGCQSNYLGVYIEQNAQIMVNTTVTNATCIENNGSAMVFGSGGMNPYTYVWSNGQTGQTASNLAGNTSYNVIATDANGCVGQGSAWIGSNTPVNVSYSSTPSQCTSPTGTATLSVSGGTAPYTYFWVSNPSATTASLANLAPGNYVFQVTDAVGCTRTGSVVVAPISSIWGSIQAADVVCPATTGTLTANISGTNGPFTYLWSNGATTESITGVPLGAYSCLITDALSCSVTKSGGLASISPVSVGLATVPVTCKFNTDGSAISVVSGGTAPYSYAYTTGATTANASNLGVGGYYLTVTDANGCSSSKYFSIGNANTNQDCYCTIVGNIYVDDNNNCTYDIGETGVQNMMVHCSDFGATFTDESGFYSFQVPSGTYTISEQVNQYYQLSSCQSNNQSVTVVAASGCSSIVNFANTMSVLHDLKVVTFNSTLPPIPGNPYQQKMVVENIGTVAEADVQLGYEHDEQLPLASSSFSGFVQLNSAAHPEWYSVQSGFPSLAPNDSKVILFNFDVPTNIPLGTTVDFYDSVAHAAPIATNWLLDWAPWNNVNMQQTSVIGSYDPNYKEVSPRGQGPEGFVPVDTKEFDYIIHFQNEGTYFAQNIVVTDQLDADLDWTTFRPGYSQYHYTTTISETGLVTFTFPSINLPWKSQYGDALSSALVHYSIKPKTGNPVGTVFTNTADIFFDYNAPITTNTTVNTLKDNVGMNENGSGANQVTTMDLYPVPVTDLLTIRVNNGSKTGAATLSIVDLMGNVVIADEMDLNEGTTIVTKSLSKLVNGTYLTRVQFEDGSSVVKKIVLVNN